MVIHPLDFLILSALRDGPVGGLELWRRVVSSRKGPEQEAFARALERLQLRGYVRKFATQEAQGSKKGYRVLVFERVDIPQRKKR